MAERDQLRLGDGSGGRGAGTGVEQAQLAEHLTWAQDGQEVLAAVDTGQPELDLALTDDVEPITAVALSKKDVSTFETRRRHRAHEGACGVVIQCGEEGALSHDINVHTGQSVRAWTRERQSAPVCGFRDPQLRPLLLQGVCPFKARVSGRVDPSSPQDLPDAA
jgi:hypothetical protein